MKINTLIKNLQRAEKTHGNLNVTTHDLGSIREALIGPTRDGVFVRENPNEIHIELVGES